MKKIRKWFKGLWKAFITEVQDRVIMSPKRIIKFIGILIVPILYGVTCMIAFWNPVPNIGKAPIAIMDNDHKIVLVRQIGKVKDENGNEKNQISLGALMERVDNGDGTTSLQVAGENPNEDLYSLINSLKTPGTQLYLNSGITISYATGTTLEVTSMWDIIKNSLLPKTDDSIADTDYTFKTEELNGEMALTNITYINDSKEIDKQWKNSKYYAQMRINNGYAANIVGVIGEILSGKEPTDEEVANVQPIQLWTTLERNYLFGYYMKTFETFASGLMIQAVPGILFDTISNSILKNEMIDGEQIIDTLSENNQPALDGINANDKYALIRVNPEQSSIEDLSLFGTIDEKGETNVVDGGRVYNALHSIETWWNSNSLWIKGLEILPLGDISTFAKTIDAICTPIANKGAENLTATIYRVTTGQGTNSDLVEYNSFANAVGMQTFSTVSEMNSTTQIITNGAYETGYVDYNTFQSDLKTIMEKHPDVFMGATNIEQFVESAIKSFIETNYTNGFSTDNIVNIEIEGAGNGLYGIGLGQFFLVIGVWVGVLMQTFIYDRGKRVKSSTKYQWYLSKTMLFTMTTLLQVTLQIWIAYAAGLSTLGITTVLFLWLFMLLSGIMFTIIIQAVWFLVKDEAIGKFLAVVIMVFSLAAGGGTFPAFAQFKFFEVISYVVPFTYVLRGTGAIIFGIPDLGTNAVTTQVVMHNVLIMCIFMVVFFTLGMLIGARNRHKEILFGSFRAKTVAKGMKLLGRTNVDDFARVDVRHSKRKVRLKYDWSVLGYEQDLELYRTVKKIKPFEKEFKWWKAKHHDFVGKPNETDDDIISRNE